MPLLKITTNKTLDNQIELMTKTSKMLAEVLKKPEEFVLIQIEDNKQMMFAGTTEEFIYTELKSVNLPEIETDHISSKICDFLSSELKIPTTRIYIEYTNSPGHMWGWNNKTFR